MARIDIDPTPNPNSLKFTVQGARLIDAGLESFASAAEASSHGLGAELFAIEGVSNVFIVPQFMTVTKRPDADWDEMLPDIERILTAATAAQNSDS